MTTSSELTKRESKMLQYCKVILEKMSFDKRLVRKEYRKCLQWLNPAECAGLKDWIKTKLKRPSKV